MAEMYATLVGSRKLSSGAPKVIHMAGFMIASKGFHGRSGYAEGADCKFDRGYKIYEEASHTEAPFAHYVPYKGFGGDTGDGIVFESLEKIVRNEAQRIARELLGESHWGNLNDFGRKAHSRNVLQVLGEDFETPSHILVCWAPPTKNGVKGGTNTAFRLAKENDIPCLNLYDERGQEEFYEFMRNVR